MSRPYDTYHPLGSSIIQAEGSIQDQEIIAQILRGDKDAYAELVRRYHPGVMALCQSMLTETDLAEDAAQEAFLNAYASLSRFRGQSSFSTWIYRIASNKCLDFKRKRARARTQSLDSILEEDGQRVSDLISVPGPERTSETAELVEKILAALPQAYRLILTLREINGLDYAQIAATMECSVDSVKARLQRARREFLDRLRHFTALEDV